MPGSYQPLQDFPQANYGESSFQNENLKWKYQGLRSYRFEVSDLAPELEQSMVFHRNPNFTKLEFQTYD